MEKVYRVEKVMENLLGIGKKTKLEKLADSFANVIYSIHPDKKNSEIGFIEFIYNKGWVIKKGESEIKKVVENFYNKEDYIISVATSEYGFDIVILNNFIKNIFKAS